MAEQFQNEQYSEMNELSGRTRVLESKYSLARDRIFLINQNMIDSHKRLMIQIDSLNSDLKEIKNDVFIIKDTLRTLIKEFDSFAKKEDVKVLEKYINMWSPLKFVTEDQLNNLLKKTVKKRGRKKT
ncbi:MAG: hypothetical protein AABW41_03185 [Nanoarchaeota archaeon]